MSANDPEDLEDVELDPLIDAGFTCAGLVAYPETWINRRVETVEMLSHEETRRRVSVDFTLPADPELLPDTGEGTAVPLSILTKQPRRHFDLRDASGASIPVLGRRQNSVVAHAALVAIGLEVIDPDELSSESFDLILESLWSVVSEPPEVALAAADSLFHEAETGHEAIGLLFRYPPFVRTLQLLIHGYILFAVIDPGERRRHVVKFSYGDDFDLRRDEPGHPIDWQLRTLQQTWWQKWRTPDSHRFFIDLEMASWAESFHLEVAIPEDLRVSTAILYADTDKGLIPMGNPDVNVNRVSLYVPSSPDAPSVSGAVVELVPERSGQIAQGLGIGALVTAALIAGAWFAVAKGTSDAAVSILLVGAAIFSGVSATRGEHILVGKIFSGARHAITLIAAAALVGSLALTFDPGQAVQRMTWSLAGVCSALATLRLALSFYRAAR